MTQGGRKMDRLEEILAANKAFVAHGKHDYTEEDIAASKLPKKKMAIFTCMDTRLTEILEPAMGIQRGDAKIIRTVGNYLTGEFDAVIRSLMVAIYELGVEEIFVVGHYECGMAKTTADSLAAAMRAHGVSEGAIAKIHGELETWANAFRDPVENVKDAVAKIAGNPYIPKNIKVHGLMIHPRTGKLDVIQTAADKPVSGEAAGQEPSSKQQWLDWTVKIQSLAQAGLHYGRDRFDLERYQELRDIAAAMMAAQADLPLAKVKDLFCNETGYQTPKIDTRAAIFQEDKILLVHESTGKWSLPGGWCDVDQSVADNTIKEVKEEAGLDVAITRVIAIDDWRRHNRCNNPYGIIKIFSLCKVLGGSFQPNIETTEAAYFSEQELPQNIALEKNSLDQIHRCFAAHRTPDWKTTMD